LSIERKSRGRSNNAQVVCLAYTLCLCADRGVLELDLTSAEARRDLCGVNKVYWTWLFSMDGTANGHLRRTKAVWLQKPTTFSRGHLKRMNVSRFQKLSAQPKFIELAVCQASKVRHTCGLWRTRSSTLQSSTYHIFTPARRIPPTCTTSSLFTGGTLSCIHAIDNLDPGLLDHRCFLIFFPTPTRSWCWL